ncbi:class I SAM-dependent methyltransferase [Okibacterium endophyticum]
MTSTTEQFAERVLGSALGMIDMLAIHMGDRLGYYRALAAGPRSPREIAAEAGTSERYAREWLEQQATTGILTVHFDGETPRFTLPPEHQAVLVDVLNPDYLAPLARMLTTAGEQMTALLEAHRVSGGVSWDAFGQGMRESQSDMNRPFFESLLADQLRGFDRVHELLSRPGSRAADIGCGAGWSSIALARAYPALTVAGYDIDAPSIKMATANARQEGVAERVSFSADDVVQSPPADTFEVVMAFECVHDMAQPVPVLTAMRELASDDGVVIVMDEAVGDEFTGRGDDIERLMYGFSLFVCLPDGLSTTPSAGTGTVMRPSTLHRYAREAGFSGVRTLGEAGFFRFYELVR